MSFERQFEVECFLVLQKWIVRQHKWAKMVYTQKIIFFDMQKKKKHKREKNCMYTYSWMDFKWNERAEHT